MGKQLARALPKRIGPTRQSVGFSMVEVVVVVLLVSLLAALLLPRYTQIVEEGKAKEAIAMLHLIRAGEEVYFSQFRTFSDALNMLNVEDPNERPLAERDWTFSINSADASDFEAQAVRERGPNTGDRYLITATGDSTGPFNP